MPEVKPERHLEPHRQCEIRRPSPAAVLRLGDEVIHKPAGYYFDIVWLKVDIARAGRQVIDATEDVWTIAETFGAKPMPSMRWAFRAYDPPDRSVTSAD